MSLRARIITIVALAVGVVLVAIPIGTNLFSKASAVDDLTDDLRPAFTDAQLAQADTDMSTIEAMAAQLGGEAIPALAEQFGTTPDAFAASRRKPDDRLEGLDLSQAIANPQFRGLVDGLRAEQGDFHLADAIPTKNLPAIVVPFLFLVPGLVLVGVAGFALLRARPRFVLPVALAIGVVLVVAPLVLRVPAKTQAVDDLTDAFRPAFSAEGLATTRQHLDTVHAMVDQLVGEALPALATGLSMPAADFQAFLGEEFPDVAQGLASIDTILGRFDALVATVESDATSFHRADSIPTSGTDTTLLHWLFVLPAIVLLALSGGVALGARVLSPRPEPVDALA